jgi:hypothetical protein
MQCNPTLTQLTLTPNLTLTLSAVSPVASTVCWLPMNGLKDANEGETDIRFTILSESRFHSRGAGVRVRVRNRDRTKWGPTQTQTHTVETGKRQTQTQTLNRHIY